MRSIATNYHFWSAAAWTIAVCLYSLGWSDLNVPLSSQLFQFLAVTICTSYLLATVHYLRPRSSVTDAATKPEHRKLKTLLSSALAIGFAADFAYRHEVPLFSGHYSGFDPTLDIQARVGIPYLHVVIIAGTIFQSLVLADAFAVSRRRGYLAQFLLLQALLLLNYSRGYVAFCVFGAILILLARRGAQVRPRKIRNILFAIVAVYILLMGIGFFGNARSGGGDWLDSSYIGRIGRFNDSYPTFLSPSLQWTYTYLTSPLANLNYNVENFQGSGGLANTALVFVPDTWGKYVTASQIHPAYLVTYLNASTGYVNAFYVGGGLGGMYACYVIQVLYLEVGAALVRKYGVESVLFDVSCCIALIVFVFYNSFSDTATCFLLPLAVAASVSARRWQVRGGERGDSRLELGSLKRF